MTGFVYTPPPGAVPVVFEDAQLIVVDKPAGLLSVPGRLPHHRDSVVSRLAGALVVHRLDMDTSGLMVLARTPEAQSDLSRQFRDRAVSKGYEALVADVPATQTGTIDLPLSADWPNRPLQKVDPEKGKPATTHWQLLDHGPPARLYLEPVTGRSHQLRLHLAHVGLPILGDRFYGGDAAPRLMLHSCHLGFDHPTTQEPMIFDLAPDF